MASGVTSQPAKSAVNSRSSITGTFTKLKLHPQKSKLSLWKAFHLLHRFGILIVAIVYFVFCMNATRLTVEILRGKDNPSTIGAPSEMRLLRQSLGTTTVRESPLYRDALDAAPRSGTLYLEESGVSSKACARMSPLVEDIYDGDFQRSLYNAVARDAAYNLTFLAADTIELIAPIVDCSSLAVELGFVSSAKLNFLVRNRQDPSDVSILTVDINSQEYFIGSQNERGPAGVAVVSLVHDLQAPSVKHHILVSMGYPYEEFAFHAYNLLRVDDEGMWLLQHIPENPAKELPFVLTTAFRTGFFLHSETDQSNVNNAIPVLSRNPIEAITRAHTASKTVQIDSWAWVHGIQLLFGLDLLLSLLTLLTVVYHNVRSGKFWIGDAFVSISSKITMRGVLVLLTWVVSGFWSFFELAYYDTYAMLNVGSMVAYDDIIRADLMCLYLMVCGIMGSVFRERVDPLLAMICFEIGFESRRSIARWFPQAMTDISAHGYANFLLSESPAIHGQRDISPMSSWRSHPVDHGSSSFVLAQLSPLLVTLVVIFAYIIYCKIYRYFLPEKMRTRRSSSTTGTSGGESMSLLQKRVLTLFEIATGAELESRFGVLSSYENYLFIKGMKFASADGIYSNGFVIANDKYVIQTDDYWSILLMKLIRKRFKNIYVYEIEGSTVQQTAKLVYPHTFTFHDLWHLNVNVLS